jgi:predicted nucleic-acid-binding Zn-ribbon protein
MAMDEQTPRTGSPPCPECGSTECVWGSLHLFGGVTSLRVTVPPSGLKQTTAGVAALVCTHCGYVRTYVNDPQRFRGE